MNTNQTEKGERVINYGLAATPQERKEEYVKSVQFIKQFQNQNSPKFTYYSKDFMKVIVWDDGNGERHCETEEIPDEEKELLDHAMDIINTYEFYFPEEYLSILNEHDVAKENDTVEAVKDMQIIRSHNELIALLAKEQAEHDKLPVEENNTRLSSEQISALRDIGAIRETNQEPGHNRLADFNQQEKAQENFSLDDPIIKEGQQVYVNEHQIRTGQDLIDALVDAYGPQPPLYGFEVYEQTDADIDKENIDEDLER